MRRVTALALITGGTMAAVTAGAFARGRLGGRGPEAPPPDEDSVFTVYAPGGRYGFMANGPVGRVISKIMPILEAGVYEVAAEMLDLQPEDELLDIGCGPGAFLATRAQHARRVVGLDASRTMHMGGGPRSWPRRWRAWSASGPASSPSAASATSRGPCWPIPRATTSASAAADRRAG